MLYLNSTSIISILSYIEHEDITVTYSGTQYGAIVYGEKFVEQLSTHHDKAKLSITIGAAQLYNVTSAELMTLPLLCPTEIKYFSTTAAPCNSFRSEITHPPSHII